MPPLKSLELEHHIVDIFAEGKSFSFDNINYTIALVGKPRPSSGECKTDVYVKGIDDHGNILELKISVKHKNKAEFLENKVTAKKALACFGEDWSSIIETATRSISSNFENRPLVFAKKKGRTQKNSVTLGWKLEIANKSRPLSVKILLTQQEIRDYVFKGTNSSEEKRNAKVNHTEIENSGVANYLLIADSDELNSVDDIVSKLQLIDDYTPPTIYLIFTANNCRTSKNECNTIEYKADSARSLAVQIEWLCKDNKLTPNFIYDQPLLKTGENDMKPILMSALKALGKAHPDELSPTDLADEQFLYS